MCVRCVPLSRSRPLKPTMSHRVSPTNGCTALCQQLNQTWTNYCFSTVYTHTQTDTFDCWTVELFGLFQLYTYTSTLVGEYRPAPSLHTGSEKGDENGPSGSSQWMEKKMTVGRGGKKEKERNHQHFDWRPLLSLLILIIILLRTSWLFKVRTGIRIVYGHTANRHILGAKDLWPANMYRWMDGKTELWAQKSVNYRAHE